MDNYFNTNLKHLRIQNGLTQQELAKKLNKDYSTIGKWELGQRNPTTLDLLKLSDIFNVSERDLVQKNLLYSTIETVDELEMLFIKNKNILTDNDRILIKTIIEQRKKEVDKELLEK